MRFSWKLFLWTITIVAATLAVGGYYIINSVFHSSLTREINQALDDSGTVRFGFEIAALNVPYKYTHLSDQDIAGIARTFDTGGGSRYIRVTGEDGADIYASGDIINGFTPDKSLLAEASDSEVVYRFISEVNCIQTAVKITAVDRTLYLETFSNIENVFHERADGFSVYRRVSVIVLVCVGVIIFLLSRRLSQPIKLLSSTAKKMARGDYSARAKKISDDELGRLTLDFNDMASALETNVAALREAARAQEEFVGAFAHELKTPLTAIIGYADVMRSQRLDEEKLMLSADYIYREGRRLEKLSFDLLDLIVVKHAEKPKSSFDAREIFAYIRETFAKNEIELRIEYDDCRLSGDGALIKTMLANLVDNAVKASEPGGVIEVAGTMCEIYHIAVRDHGCGISPEHLTRLTEAFYVADKSRSRSRHGAGLGLSLCAEIARLHGTELKIESVPGEGTTVSFDMTKQEAEKDVNRF